MSGEHCTLTTESDPVTGTGDIIDFEVWRLRATHNCSAYFCEACWSTQCNQWKPCPLEGLLVPSTVVVDRHVLWSPLTCASVLHVDCLAVYGTRESLEFSRYADVSAVDLLTPSATLFRKANSTHAQVTTSTKLSVYWALSGFLCVKRCQRPAQALVKDRGREREQRWRTLCVSYSAMRHKSTTISTARWSDSRLDYYVQYN